MKKFSDHELKRLLDLIDSNGFMSPDKPNYDLWEKIRHELGKRQQKEWDKLEYGNRGFPRKKVKKK